MTQILNASAKNILLCALALVFLAAPSKGRADSETVIYSFQGGGTPEAGLIADAAGNSYGTSIQGGNDSIDGQVFKISPKGILTTYYSFAGGSDGAAPEAGLYMDSKGNIFGTTNADGAHGHGTVFEVRRDGKEVVLYSFCAKANCVDGANPQNSGVIMDSEGNLYGTTTAGGKYTNYDGYSGGTVFELTPNKAGTKWKEKVLHNFCQYTDCVDGYYPDATLVMDGAENLYGTTVEGGLQCEPLGCGTVFKMKRNKTLGTFQESVLYSFCPGGYCTSGSYPSGSLIMDSSGNLYGTTQQGGPTGNCPSLQGCGTVFKLTPRGSEAPEVVLYNFCSKTGCSDGMNPYAGLSTDASGNLYGTTLSGGGNYNEICTNSSGNEFGCGVAFELDLQGTETVLYSFCAQSGCTDGANPSSTLLVGASGELLGTTTSGGSRSYYGSVFQLVP